MTEYTTGPLPGGRMYLARTRGMASGMLLMLLGAWAAIVPFIGTYLNFAFTPTAGWTWTAGRGWYEVLPGAVAFAGGLLLVASAHRAVAVFGAWLGILAGAWLIVGPQLSDILHLGSIGSPTSTSAGIRDLERLLYFTGIGGAMLLVAGVALGRLSVRSMRDIQVAGAREAAAADAVTERRTAIGAPATAGTGASTGAGTGASAMPANRPHDRHLPFLWRHRAPQQDMPVAAGRPATTSRNAADREVMPSRDVTPGEVPPQDE